MSCFSLTSERCCASISRQLLPLVHHDTREKTILYPLLDRVTTQEEKDGLFALLKSRPTH
jgi:hypothetical protein